MARAATRPARLERERKEGRKSQRPSRAAGRTLIHNGHVHGIPAPENPKASAIHEAGHCIVAHALGLRVIFATIKREIVLPGGVYRKGCPAEHPNTSGELIVDDGFNVAEPLLADEVNACAAAGLPLSPEQRIWLAQSAVSSAAGPFAEAGAGFRPGGVSGDRQQVGQCAGLLGRKQEHRGNTVADPGWVKAVEHDAAIILSENWVYVEAFAERLLADIELDAEACQAALDGLPCGNYEWMIEDLLADG
jgi:hypothetical protein